MSGPGDLIGVDWGTTRLRVFRLSGDGAILEERSSDHGMGSLQPSEFPSALRQALEGWRTEGVPIVCCGMVGARQGWIEAPYVATPASAADVAAAMIRAPGDLPVWIVPGACMRGADGGLADVMRGEETQVFGAAAPEDSGLFLCPGTHGKWAQMENGRLVRFRTFMTGELNGLLSSHSVLRHSLGPAEPAPEAFAAGVRRALDGEPLISALFTIRVAGLAGCLNPVEAAATLSGLLIGSEIKAALDIFSPAPARIIGAPALTDRYAAALSQAGFKAINTLNASEVTARGLAELWRLRETR